MLLSINMKANDGGYYGSGNQLIPIIESDISVKKEILSIIRNTQNDRLVNVSVYYEFYNPGKSKTLTVGFEANSPYGDAEIASKNGEQPYISDFSVLVNNQQLPYEVAIVKDSVYYKNGVFNVLTKKEMDDDIEECGECSDFFYVYHFDATFKPGLNIIKHTYTYELSGSVDNIYSFGYVLSAAMRWQNKQIDDFTLIIDLGRTQEVYIPMTFFDNIDDWKIEGRGSSQISPNKMNYLDETNKENALVFLIQEGQLIFKKKNFKPAGELFFYSPRGLYFSDTFNYKENVLPFNFSFYYDDLVPTDELSKKILRNLPFAYRGYVFTNPKIQDYYDHLYWYLPNSFYQAEIDQLSEEEKEWVNYWSNYKLPQISKNFDYKKIPNIFYYAYINSDFDITPNDEVSKKILRNLPFAYKGYVFTNPILQQYFEQQTWYNPNPNYKPEIEDLTVSEQKWVSKWSQ